MMNYAKGGIVIRRVIVAMAAAVTATACGIVFPQAYAYEIVAINRASSPYVVAVEEYRGHRYYPISSDGSVRIDTVTHGNPPPDAIKLYDVQCLVVDTIVSPLGEGGILTIVDDARLRFEPGRRLTTPIDVVDHLTGYSSCEDALDSILPD